MLTRLGDPKRWVKLLGTSSEKEPSHELGHACSLAVVAPTSPNVQTLKWPSWVMCNPYPHRFLSFVTHQPHQKQLPTTEPI